MAAFVEVLRDHEDLAAQARAMMADCGERVPAEIAHQALAFAVDFTKDPDLGLKAANALVPGAAGAVDYVAISAPTVRDAIDALARYVRLVNDVVHVELVVDGPNAVLRFDNELVLPRPAADFQVAGFYRTHVRRWFEGGRLAELTVWFSHRAPADVSEYERTFSPAALRFSAPANGFRFDAALLDLPVPGADPNLHGVMVPLADQTLRKLPDATSVTQAVRQIVTDRLESGVDIAEAAATLGMSTRTLARRLETEGTTFRDLLDDVRRTLALEYVGERDLEFSEIAYRVGFSEVAAFHRAFRRWTGETPLHYRRARRR